MGIDPGTTRIGFGIIRKEKGKLYPVRYGILPHSPSDKYTEIKQVVNELQKLVRVQKPEIAAVEKIFFFKNQKTMVAVSEMRGVILATLAMLDLPIYEFTPLEVKQAVSSYGRAGKDQVEAMVRLILGLREKIKPDDAADGLAIAICCANNILPTDH